MNLRVQAQALLSQSLKIHEELKSTPASFLKPEVVYYYDAEIKTLGAGAEKKEEL